MKNNQNGFIIPLIIAIVILISGGFYLYSKNKISNENNTVGDQNIENGNTEPVVSEKTNVKENNSSDSNTSNNKYTNTKYGFEFKYPSNWSVKDQGTFITLSNYSDEYLANYHNKNGEFSNPSDAQMVFISIEKIDSKVALNEYLNDKRWAGHASKDVTISNNVSGIQAVFDSGEGLNHPVTKYFFKNGNIVINISNSTSLNYQKELIVENQVINSLIFLNSN